MVDADFLSLPHLPDGSLRPELERQRQEMLGFNASQDANKDGYLSLNEFLTGPLASFDCMDENHDGKLSKEEVSSGMTRCPVLNLDDYSPKP
jgi:Ca2+-binding EF-hand superfamily protein